MDYAASKINTAFEMDYTIECIRSFNSSTGVTCRLLTADGQPLYFSKTDGGADTQSCSGCAVTHARAGRDSERFGGRYIYLCPGGYVFFAAPITVNGKYTAFLSGGPVSVTDGDDRSGAPPVTCPHRKSSDGITNETPERIKYLSHQLFMTASHISGLEHYKLMTLAETDRQQADIGGYVQSMKMSDEKPVYPLEDENEMLAAIETGNKPLAGSLLNQLLGHIFFATGGDFHAIRTRVVELIVLLSRAAIRGGAHIDEVFTMNYRYLAELDSYKNIEGITYWLSKIMTRYTEIVFDLSDVKHVDVLYKAIEYMKLNYMNRITLEQVADFVYLSPSYLSRIFKQEMSYSFTAYLNNIRIEKSKIFLLSTDYDIIVISEKVGFEDQSYYSKVFKKVTGVTPGRFRTSRGNIRLNYEAEKNNAK